MSSTFFDPLRPPPLPPSSMGLTLFSKGSSSLQESAQKVSESVGIPQNNSDEFVIVSSSSFHARDIEVDPYETILIRRSMREATTSLSEHYQKSCADLKAIIGEMNYNRFMKSLTNVDGDTYVEILSKRIRRIEQEINIAQKGQRTIVGGLKNFKEVARGALKKVWVTESNRTKVYYTALSYFGKSELRSEIGTTLDIGRKLKIRVFDEFLAECVKRKAISKESAQLLKNKFSSLQEFEKAMESRSVLPMLFSDDPKQLKRLRTYVRSTLGKNAIDRGLQRGEHLAIRVKELEGQDRIEGQYTLETDRADGDLEEFLRTPNIYTTGDIRDVIGQILDGMSDLHAAGYVHGDLKPENSLVTWIKGRWYTKISDFGKARRAPTDSNTKWLGNTRFAPWENRLTQQGEVCSMAIQMIRILEQRVLEEARKGKNEILLNILGKTPKEASKIRSLISPQNPGPYKAASAGKKLREGFEVFAIESADFNTIEADYSRSQKVSARLYQAKMMIQENTREQNLAIESEKSRYIEKLKECLIATGFGSEEGVEALCALIQRMSAIDPKKRPTMREASNQYQRIVQDFFE